LPGKGAVKGLPPAKIQPGQQDRSWQAGGKEGHRAAGDDSDDLVAPGEFSKELRDPRQRLGERGICDDR